MLQSFKEEADFQRWLLANYVQKIYAVIFWPPFEIFVFSAALHL
jgi:hypothetical protein